MPVNAQIGFMDIAKLQSVLTAPGYAHGLIFVAWEHGMLNKFARQMLKRATIRPRCRHGRTAIMTGFTYSKSGRTAAIQADLQDRT